MLNPFELKPWKAQATNPYEKGLQSVVLVCVENECQGHESQGRTYDYDFV